MSAIPPRVPSAERSRRRLRSVCEVLLQQLDSGALDVPDGGLVLSLFSHSHVVTLSIAEAGDVEDDPDDDDDDSGDPPPYLRVIG